MKFRKYTITFPYKLNEGQEGEFIGSLQHLCKDIQRKIKVMLWKMKNHVEFKILRKAREIDMELNLLEIRLGEMERNINKYIVLGKKEQTTEEINNIGEVYLLYIAQAEFSTMKREWNVLGKKIVLGKPIDDNALISELQRKPFKEMGFTRPNQIKIETNEVELNEKNEEVSKSPAEGDKKA